MASEADHISLANKNHSTLVFLLTDYEHHAEWIATVAFYKAVHIVEAVFCNQTQWHSSNHDDRRSHLKRTMTKKYYQNFDVLYQKSRIARYLEDSSSSKYRQFTDHMSPDVVVKELVGKRLNTIEQMSLEHLSDGVSLTTVHVPSLPCSH